MWTVTLDARTLLSMALAVVGLTALAYSHNDSAQAEGAARRAPRATHVQQDVDDLVVLRLTNPTTTPTFVRVNADGTQATAEFVVPQGRRLVVTDVDHFIEQNLASKTSVLRLRLQSRSSSAVSLAYLVAANALGGSTSAYGTSVPFGGSSGLLTGFVVAPDARIVADLVATTAVTQTATAAFNRTAIEVILRGYLTTGE